jgi:hypothetical protein
MLLVAGSKEPGRQAQAKRIGDAVANVGNRFA